MRCFQPFRQDFRGTQVGVTSKLFIHEDEQNTKDSTCLPPKIS
jgi:hypothetical protein